MHVTRRALDKLDRAYNPRCRAPLGHVGRVGRRGHRAQRSSVALPAWRAFAGLAQGEASPDPHGPRRGRRHGVSAVGRLGLGGAADACRRDGLFKRHGWWWIDYHDGQGKRHRKRAAPDYQTAASSTGTPWRPSRGVRCSVSARRVSRVSAFIETRYWPTVKPNLSVWEQLRARSILDTQILPQFGDLKLVRLDREDIERWQAERRGRCVRLHREQGIDAAGPSAQSCGRLALPSDQSGAGHRARQGDPRAGCATSRQRNETDCSTGRTCQSRPKTAAPG